ncbi:hypothetical protein MSG28_007123 [Choristoneura fumiferana]|uniref:Uncharacterized protein n=1 Tax=Choristoneura fumiferana TaxID=7141 RepID=A0ACC0JMS4_CHOFU|nr:hypothetical protein MSG28_007123 [Choristoneura fumiferana]
MDPGTSYEVFRNNDTAIELIVKDTSLKNQKVSNSNLISRGLTIKRLQTDMEKLRDKLNKANADLESSRHGFKAVTGELKKQLDLANQRENEIQTKNLGLQLENEKLHALLESKTILVDKLKKELQSMKRVLKFAIKGICSAPQVPENITFSDLDYEDFENDLQRDCKVRFADSPRMDTMDTIDSSLLKNSLANSFEKRF